MKRDVSKILVKPDCTIKETIEIIDKGTLGIALVIEDNRCVLGTVTDGDIRRAILKGIKLEEPIAGIMNKNFTFVNENASLRFISRLFEIKGIKQIPILNDDGQIVDIVLVHDIFEKPAKENWAVIMGGGLGTRLRPLTYDVPKPMLKIGGKPLLEILVEQLKAYGFTNILMSVNYKGYMIQSYFRDGRDFGVNIEYIKEKERLGTAGALKLAQCYLDKPFLVLNGDILTKLNYEQFMEFHMQNNADITVATRSYDICVPYGVVNIDNADVLSLEEKPRMEFFINAGMYCLNPEMINYIPESGYYDITQLIDLAIRGKRMIKSFPIREYWLDIGHIPDYERANEEYYKIFGSEVSAVKE